MSTTSRAFPSFGFGLDRLVQTVRKFAGIEPLRGGTARDYEFVAGARLANHNAAGNAGRVILVGAGPGDAELLTVKAIRALQTADAILYDALVGGDVLDWANPSAELVFVGKRGGCRSWKQDDINLAMARRALAGKTVVRLKGGDPGIFGRSGEEIAYLTAAGVPAGIIPGVTSASAMAAAFGLSLTHRSSANSVRFITGHSKRGGLPADIDWTSVASPAVTTIIYMGAPHAGQIVEKLLAHGMAADTPAGVAAALSRPDEQLRTCTLGTLVLMTGQMPAGQPIIIGVGPAFGLHAKKQPAEWIGVSAGTF